MSIVAEAPGFIQVFSDGSVKRFAPETAVASPLTSAGGYKSKDVTVDASKPINARIFRPDDEDINVSGMPVLVYFHGGGFCIGSTTWLGYHIFLGNLAATAKTIIVSVDYRLAPEHRLPTSYEDCYSALEWLGSKADPWLRNADLSRVFLCGDSAGGNIAHHVTIKAIKNKIHGVTVKGLVPIHPFFGSERRTELELAEGSGAEVAMNDMFWRLSLPDGADRDFYGCDFEKAEAEWSLFPALLVFVSGLDFLKERGVMYSDFMKKKGVKEVKLIEAEGEVHVFHAWFPESEATFLLQKQITDFIRIFH
ncbi:Carboxyesterase 17 [Dorcoceras hygrometricum]|uniref:Carboxyesterase 17 n=1 Tax=Dorcoceras hygrometricum TaxID=472368 RepID=A0A2Z7CMP1_9LAMI|nr:Carboxyesterase 17 [Dorcoceras hygrometricum]